MRCYQCGGTYIAKHESLEFTDKYIGPFTVETAEYFECDKCGDYLFSPETSKRIETARRLALEEKLQSLSISAFITAVEAATILGISRQALHKHRRIRRGFIFQTRFCDKTVYLKKSVDLFKETGDGRFQLVEPESEIQHTSEPKTTAILERMGSGLALQHFTHHEIG
jgi:hypothetical protein